MREQSIAQVSGSANPNRGNGNDDHAPIGMWSYDTDYVSRELMRFTHDWSGMTKVTKIELHVRLSNTTHTAHGSTRRMYVGRLNGPFSMGGGGENSWSWGISGSEWGDPGLTASGGEDFSLTAYNSGDWVTLDITTVYDDFIPSYVKNPAGGNGAGATNDGIRLWSYDENTVARTVELYTMRTGSAPYIVVTYTTNTAPGTPTLTGPANGAVIASGSQPSFSFAGYEVDSGDNMKSFDLQIDDSSGFGSPVYNGNVPTFPAAPWWNGAQTVTNWPYPGGGLVAGTTYYWRVRTYDQSDAVGPWSAARSFTMGATPTIGSFYPGASQLAPISNLGEAATWTSGGAHAKPQVSFAYAHPGGLAGTHYRVRLYSDGSTTLYDSGTVARALTPGTTYYINVPYAIVMGTQYRWGVEVRDSAGNWSANMAPSPFKVRWGQAIYTQNVTVNASNIQLKTGSLTGSTVQSAFLYRTADDAAGTGATGWVSDPGSIATMKAYLHILVRLSTYVAGTNPALSDMTLTYQGGTALVPDKWTIGSGTAVLDPGSKRFGKYGLRLTAAGTGVWAYPYHSVVGDDVDVQPDTDYTISAWVNTGGAPLRSGSFATLYILKQDGSIQNWWLTPQPVGMVRTTFDSTAFPNHWQQLVGVFHVPPGVTTIRPLLWAGNAMVAGDRVWWDGVRLEQGRVAQSWTPGFLSDGAVLDSHGLQVDARSGGIFRLHGSADDPRFTVDLAAYGLRFGGDSLVDSPNPGAIRVHPTLDIISQVSAPANPVSPYFRIYGQGSDLLAKNSGGQVYRLSMTYEEGTWTPGLTFGTPGNLSVAYSTQSGRYVKIGRRVFLDLIIITTTFTHSTASGSLLLTGLPFATAGGLNLFNPIIMRGHNVAGGIIGLRAIGTTADFGYNVSGSAIGTLTPTQVPTGTVIDIRASWSHEVTP